MPLGRRGFLTTAAAVPFAAAAGCTGRFDIFGSTETGTPSGDTAPPEPPGYARWVPATGPGGEGTFFLSIDWTGVGHVETLREDLPTGESSGEATADPDATTPATDALRTVPVSGGLIGAGGARFLLLPYFFPLALFEPYVENLYPGYFGAAGGTAPADGVVTTPAPESTETPRPETPTATPEGSDSFEFGTMERLVMTAGAIVLEGTFDLEAVAEIPTATEVVAGIPAATDLERAGSHRGAAMYEGTVNDSDVPMVFGARESALVFGIPPILTGRADDETPTGVATLRTDVERVLDAAAGATERLANRSDEAAWMLDRAGPGHVLMGAWGRLRRGAWFDRFFQESGVGEAWVRAQSTLGWSDGEVYTHTYGESERTGNMAAVYADGGAPDRDTVTTTVGNTADEREVEVDDGRVSVTGTWSVEP